MPPRRRRTTSHVGRAGLFVALIFGLGCGGTAASSTPEAVAPASTGASAPSGCHTTEELESIEEWLPGWDVYVQLGVPEPDNCPPMEACFDQGLEAVGVTRAELEQACGGAELDGCEDVRFDVWGREVTPASPGVCPSATYTVGLSVTREGAEQGELLGQTYRSTSDFRRCSVESGDCEAE